MAYGNSNRDNLTYIPNATQAVTTASTDTDFEHRCCQLWIVTAGSVEVELEGDPGGDTISESAVAAERLWPGGNGFVMRKIIGSGTTATVKPLYTKNAV